MAGCWGGVLQLSSLSPEDAGMGGTPTAKSGSGDWDWVRRVLRNQAGARRLSQPHSQGLETRFFVARSSQGPSWRSRCGGSLVMTAAAPCSRVHSSVLFFLS